MCDEVGSENSFFIVYCPDTYITQKMCDEAVDDSLATLRLIPDWFVTSKMIEKRFTTLYADEYIFYFNEDSGNVAFICNGMDIFNPIQDGPFRDCSGLGVGQKGHPSPKSP